jgi:class 3 adenylate cyclase/tetratricopeptide (TPR) repeat protein
VVVDLVDRRKSGGDGTPAAATILFADMVGSTQTLALFEEEDWRDAQENARDLFDDRINAAAAIVRKYGGTVARVQGDGIMAAFGAPKPLEKHAFNACAAALEIRDLFRNTGDAESGAVRVGVHSGRVLTRVRENDFGTDLDIVGLAVNRAKKVEEACPPNAALVSRETLQLAGAAVEARHWDAGVFELVGVAPHYDLERQFPIDLLEPFVGREDVIERLEANLDQVFALKAKGIGIIGAAGLGKSRILFEFARRAEARGLRVIEVRGHAVHRLTPFAPIKPLVAKLLQSDGEGAAASLAKRELPPLLAQGLLELIGAKTGDMWDALDAPARRAAMIEATCLLVAQAARRGPLLLLADDAHEFDAETLDVVLRLKTLFGELPLVMVATSRNVGAHPLLPADEIIELDNLTYDQAVRFAQSTAAGAPIDEAEMARAVTNAAGNPLFLQSLIRHLRSGKKGEATPAELTSLVQTRMSKLGDAAKAVLWAVSVLRANFARGTLAAAAGVEESALDQLLIELERQDLVAVDAAGIRFRHDLFRGAVDELLVRRQRHELHRRAHSALESEPRTAELLEQLTYHSEMAGDFIGALGSLLQAIQLAVRTSSLKTIRALYARAKDLASKGGPDAVPAMVGVAAASFDALQQSGDSVEYRNALEFVANHATRAGDRMSEGIARAHLAILCWMRAEHEAGFQHATAALKIADEHKSITLRALAQPHLANIEHARGNLDRSIALHTEVIDLLEGEYEKSTLGRMIVPSVRSRAFAAWFLIDRGRFDEAQQHIDRGEEVLRAIDQPYSRVLLNNARGYLLWRTGRTREAIAPLEAAHKSCYELQFYVMEPSVSAWLAGALCDLGEYERARQIAAHSVDTGLYKHGGRYPWVFIHLALGEALYGCKQPEAALEKIAEGLKIAQESSEPIQIAQALLAQGRMLLKQGQRDRGLDDIRAALTLAVRHHLDPLATECKRLLGQ